MPRTFPGLVGFVVDQSRLQLKSELGSIPIQQVNLPYPIHKTAGYGTAADQAIDLVMAPNGFHIISCCCMLFLH